METKKTEFNIFSKLYEEIDDFNNNTIVIAQPENAGGSIRNLKGKQAGYIYSQRQVLNLVDLYDNSKFEKGVYDSEGQRKLFLNVCKFRREVAAKQTSLKVADFVFIPDNYGQIKKTSFMARKFKIWARENDYGETIEEFNDDLSKYGTVVAKRVGKKMVRVVLRSLINSQDAKSLESAAKSGGYVIEEHEYTKAEMKKYKDWDLEGITYDKKTGKAKVYERYGLAPETFTDENGDSESMVLTMSILAPQVKDLKMQKTGKVVFKEQVEDLPYEECHWSKQDGRWLGIGEVENQFENQIAKNFTGNMRRRSILWAAKKVLQSKGDMIARNLVRDVKDGEILQVGMNGEISKVDLSSPGSMAELNADDQIWDKNSDQKSFTYEVVTGEGLPSGTPFRLGVLLSNAAASHFERKRRKFGRFLERIFYNHLIEVFKKDTKEHTLQIANNSEGIEQLQDAMVEYLTGKKVIDNLLYQDKLITKEEAQAQVEALLLKTPYLFYDIPDGYYDDAKFSMQLETAGNSENTRAEVESVTNLISIALKNPDALDHPVIRRLLNWVMAKTGRSLDNILGSIKAQSPALPATPAAKPLPAPVGQGAVNPLQIISAGNNQNANAIQ